MSKGVVVIMGVCQTDFYNPRIFDRVADGLHEGLKIFKEGKYEYVGVDVEMTKDGRVTPESISVAFDKFQSLSFGSMTAVHPKLFQIGV